MVLQPPPHTSEDLMCTLLGCVHSEAVLFLPRLSQGLVRLWDDWIIERHVQEEVGFFIFPVLCLFNVLRAILRYDKMAPLLCQPFTLFQNSTLGISLKKLKNSDIVCNRHFSESSLPTSSAPASLKPCCISAALSSASVWNTHAIAGRGRNMRVARPGRGETGAASQNSSGFAWFRLHTRMCGCQIVFYAWRSFFLVTMVPPPPGAETGSCQRGRRSCPIPCLLLGILPWRRGRNLPPC